MRKYDKDEIDVGASFQGMIMVAQFVDDAQSGLPQIKLEDVAVNPNIFLGLVRYLTKERCEFSPELWTLVRELEFHEITQRLG